MFAFDFFVKIILKFLIRYFVASLVLAILIWIFLDGVVCQMYKEIAIPFESEYSWRSANIALWIPVGFEGSIKASD